MGGLTTEPSQTLIEGKSLWVTPGSCERGPTGIQTSQNLEGVLGTGEEMETDA